MPDSRRISTLLLVALLCFSSGCLFTHHSTNLVRQDEPPREVQFESLAAQQAFNAKAFDEEARQKAAKTDFVAIPFLLWWSKMHVLSEGAYYNDQVAVCDTDGDGLISVGEALAYNPTSSLDSSKIAESQPEAGTAPSGVQPASLQQPADAPTPDEVLR